MIPAARDPRGGWVLAVLLSLTAPAPLADAISDLPAPWRERLQPIPEVDVSGAEPLARQAIREARETLSARLATPGTDPILLASGYGQLGAIYQLHEVQSAAERCYANARHLQPDTFRWPYYGGYLALRAGHSEQALEQFRAAQALGPDYPPLRLRLGEVWMDKGDFAQARSLFEQTAQVEGLQAAALYYLGQLDLLDRRFEAAIEHFEQALRLNPQAAEVHYPLAQAYRALGRDALAREHLGRFRLRIPTAEDPLLDQLEGALKRSVPLFGRGMQAIYERDPGKAAELFAHGLAVDPDNAAARVTYARALYLSGDPAGAERELRATLARQPGRVLAHFLLGTLAEAAGRDEEASGAYQETLRLDPAHAGAHFALGNLLFRRGDFPAATRHYQAALEADRDIFPARLLRLLALRQTGEPDASLAAALIAELAGRSQDPALQYARLRLLALSPDPAVHNPAAALELATGLVAQQPFPPFLEALALAQAAAGYYGEAAETAEGLIAVLAWMAPPAELERLRRDADRYRQQTLPAEVWPTNDPFLRPPPFDPAGPFRDYPAAVPF